MPKKVQESRGVLRFQLVCAIPLAFLELAVLIWEAFRHDLGFRLETVGQVFGLIIFSLITIRSLRSLRKLSTTSPSERA
jgi:hypothetical protein